MEKGNVVPVHKKEDKMLVKIYRPISLLPIFGKRFERVLYKRLFKKLIKCEKKENSIFSIYDPLGVKLLTRLRLQFSNLNEHKFRHGFGDTINTMCACGSEVETTKYFLLRCHVYSPQILELFENLEKVDSRFLKLKLKEKASFLLYGFQSATSKSSNYEILKFVIKYTKETARFDSPLFCPNH